MLMPTIAPSVKATEPLPFRLLHELELAAAPGGELGVGLHRAFEPVEIGHGLEERQGVQAVEPELLADRRHPVGGRDLHLASGLAAIQRHLLQRPS